MTTDITSHAQIPMQWIGPIRITGNALDDEVTVPLATYESPLWPSVARGARISRQSPNGIVATVLDDRMARSILLEADNAAVALAATTHLTDLLPDLQTLVSSRSRHTRLLDIHHQIVGNLLYLRFEFTTGDASGHNMATLAAEWLTDWILTSVPGLQYGSISGNYCTDKKSSAVNGILGRGKSLVTELTIPEHIVRDQLRTSAQQVVDLNIRKNLIGTTVAGGIRSANAHYANMLLAVYLATGQDAANIVEGSQGITHAENREGALYFSCTLPNLIVGTVGNGKTLGFVDDNLAMMGCQATRESGANAKRLAAIIASTVLCGELSLMAAQTNPGELMRTHVKFERSPAT